MKWHGTVEPKPKVWSHKKDIPVLDRTFAQQIEFRFTTGYIIYRRDSGILLANGNWQFPVKFWDNAGAHIGWSSSYPDPLKSAEKGQ